MMAVGLGCRRYSWECLPPDAFCRDHDQNAESALAFIQGCCSYEIIENSEEPEAALAQVISLLL